MLPNSNPSHLFRVSADGGTPRRVTKVEGVATGEWSHGQPSSIPGTNGVLFTVSMNNSEREIGLLDLESETHRRIIENAYNARYAISGHVVFVRNGGLWAVPFDTQTMQVTGDAELVEPELQFRAGGAAD